VLSFFFEWTNKIFGFVYLISRNDSIQLPFR
jgi:hypothetical protein